MPRDEATPDVDAALNTWLALERTLMSWIRTCATLIGLGFTITKVFDFLHQLQNTTPPTHILGYRSYSLVVLGIGVVALVAAVVQHRNLLRRWWPHDTNPPFSLATTVAVMFSVFGAAVFVIVLLGY